MSVTTEMAEKKLKITKIKVKSRSVTKPRTIGRRNYNSSKIKHWLLTDTQPCLGMKKHRE